MKQLPGLPNLIVTTLVFFALAGLSRQVNALIKAKTTTEGDDILDDLAETHRPKTLSRMADRCENVRLWDDHVTSTLKRRFREMDYRFAMALQDAERYAKDTVATEKVYAYVAPSTDSIATTPEALLSAIAGRRRGLTTEELQEMLLDSEEALTKKCEDLQRLISEHEPRTTRLQFWADLGWKVALYPMYGVFLAAPALLWMPFILSRPPFALTLLAEVGGGFCAISVLTFLLMEQVGSGKPTSVNSAERRLGDLRVVENYGCWEMLNYLKHSLSARQWHHHVVHTQKRQFRWQDVCVMRALVDAEKKSGRNVVDSETPAKETTDAENLAKKWAALLHENPTAPASN